MDIFKNMLKRTFKPKFPIADIKELSNDEIEFLIKKFQSRQEDLNWSLQQNNEYVTDKHLKFHELITKRFTEQLLDKKDFSKVELEILNGMFQQEANLGVEFMLMTEIMSEKNSSVVMNDLKLQGFEFIENVGLIRIRNYKKF
ncbi:hypothetical protein P9Z80_24165 [Bacillus cereus]|nr:hypothetical protein [Bacillus cereus]MEC3260707.1 hypothetical protein [Bacillus cereus]